MADFVLSLLDLCLWPFRSTDCLFIFVPTVCLTISFLFALISRLILRR